MARMFICNTHKTVDMLGDYATENDMEGEFDYELQDVIRKHLAQFGGTVENTDGKHAPQLMYIADDELALIDASRLKQAVMDGRLEDFLKEEREQYKQDALGCYELRGRPTYGIGYATGCIDYKTKGKAIGRTTGIPEDEWNYVCDFCPYNSYVEHYQNKKVNWK